MAKRYVIVVGGGTGSRMQSAVPKQFMLLNGLPILMHTLKAFAESQTKPAIILVLNSQITDEWDRLCRHHAFQVPHSVVRGGNTRFHSVLNGLNHIKTFNESSEVSYIAVHDGVRPLVSKAIIDNGFQAVEEHAALVTAISSKDSVRIKDPVHQSKAVDRSNVFLVQTPQFFSSEVLFKAYEQDYDESFTDDSSVVEKNGYPIQLTPGDTRNIKITFPEDLLFAESMLKSAIKD